MTFEDKTLMIDPPSGWRYGFPRPVPKNFFEDSFDLGGWLITEGYPAADVELVIKYSRYYEVSNEPD